MKRPLFQVVPLFAVTVFLLAFAGKSNSFAVTETLSAYTLRADWTNGESVIWDVHGAPRTVPAALPAITPSVSVHTDGSGRITGAGSLEIMYNATDYPFSLFSVDIAGKISSTVAKPLPAVTLRLKGSGYTVDSNGLATLAKVSLLFKGQPGIDPSNPNRTRIVGTLSGTLHGPTPLGEKSARLDGIVAFINGSSSNNLSLSVDLLENTKKLLAVDPSWSGKGSINTRSNTFKLGLRGQGSGRGENLALTGGLGTYTNSIGSNDIVFTAPVSLSGKGKVSGQVVSGTAAEVQADLIGP